jgi:hypothetical protein
MLDSYFTFCKTPLVAYDKNIQVVCYSYNERSYTFVGLVNNRTRHSPSSLVFLKKFIPADGSALIFSQGRLLGEVTKQGSTMQLPIHSFNTKHTQQDVRVETGKLLFNISNNNTIEISTGD